jgi:hypothetical protein
MRLFFFIGSILLTISALAQDTSDVEAVRRTVNLSEVIVRSDLNVPKFLQRIKNDTSYYKAFKNLRVLQYTSLNAIHMRDKKGAVKASLESKTRQKRDNGCRSMEVLQEKVTGDFYDKNRNYEYFTAELYASLFFTKGTVCGESNIVSGVQRNVKDKKGIAKHKEQLKMLFFNPGKKIPGIPFIGDKLDVFDEDVARYYDYSIDTADLNGHPAYVFAIKRKADLSGGERDKIVYDNITTWFNQKTMQIIARKYDLSYDAGVYDFDVHMEVQMQQIGNLIIPQVMRYSGEWFVLGKGRERGVFTATISLEP